MFESLDVPVFCDADVVIAGAGPAGIGAAIASAMQGRKTVLLEQTGSAGGMSTNSLIPIILHQGDGKRVVVGNICHSIVRDACAEMGIHEVHPLWQPVDTEALKRVCDRRLLEAGVKVFYMIRIADAIRRGNRIEALLVATSSGLQKVTGRVFVDCTGDGSVAAFAGVPFDKGDGRRQYDEPHPLRAVHQCRYGALPGGESPGAFRPRHLDGNGGKGRFSGGGIPFPRLLGVQ